MDLCVIHSICLLAAAPLALPSRNSTEGTEAPSYAADCTHINVEVLRRWEKHFFDEVSVPGPTVEKNCSVVCGVRSSLYNAIVSHF